MRASFATQAPAKRSDVTAGSCKGGIAAATPSPRLPSAPPLDPLCPPPSPDPLCSGETLQHACIMALCKHENCTF